MEPNGLQTGAFKLMSAYKDELRERSRYTSYLDGKIQASLGDYFISNEPELESIHPEQMAGNLLADVCIGRGTGKEVIEVETGMERYLHKKIPKSGCHGYERSRTARAHELSVSPKAAMKRLRRKFSDVPPDHAFSICVPYRDENLLAAFLEELGMNGPPVSRLYLYSEKEDKIVGCALSAAHLPLRRATAHGRRPAPTHRSGVAEAQQCGERGGVLKKTW